MDIKKGDQGHPFLYKVGLLTQGFESSFSKTMNKKCPASYRAGRLQANRVTSQ